MATPFPFGSGNVLTAAQMNAITTLPVSTKTASYTLTVADVGYRIVMNSASATTITVNTSIFGASDKVEILNIGAGVCTVTAGTCTVGTSGTLALVQNAGGTLTFISASASVFTASGVTASASGLTLINRTSFSGVASQTFDGVFTSTYGSYLVVIESLFGATATSYVSWQWRYSSTTQTTQCNSGSPGLTAAGAANNAYAAGASECVLANTIGTTLVPSAASFTVSNVGLTATPIFRGTMWTSYDAVGRMVGGNCEQQRNYDGFLIKASSGNATGIVAVYGLAKS